MKTLPYIVVSALAMFALLTNLNAPALGATNWDAMGEISKLKEQVANLTSKVSALEEQLKTVELRPMIISSAPVPPSVQWQQPPIEIKTQDEILNVFKRGMFVPAR